MDSGQFTVCLIGTIKDEMISIAEDAVLRPKLDLLSQGVTAGRYQGLKLALDIVDAILRDRYAKEAQS